MPKQIIKLDRDDDLYVEWSSIVEAPTAWGPRDWMLDHLMRSHRHAEPERYAFEREQTEKRLQRADDTGSSAYELGCTWDDAGEIYMQQGFLPRARMREALDRFTDGEQDSDLSDLLRPFDESGEGKQ